MTHPPLPDALVRARRARFPLGAGVDLEEIERDPYPTFSRLRTYEPISWVAPLNMWWVTRHADAREILLDSAAFTTGWRDSSIFETFGLQMLTAEGEAHGRYRRAAMPPLAARRIREALEPMAGRHALALAQDLRAAGEADLRPAFAARLPVLTMLSAFGLPLEGEVPMRGWFDRFERALANLTGAPEPKAAAAAAREELDVFLDDAIARARRSGEHDTLLGSMVNAEGEDRLADDEIRRNASIILFGGISTVEALILNALWSLARHGLLDQARQEAAFIEPALEETLRWQSPVQSAIRHVTRDCAFSGVDLVEGDVVACMLGAANRDPDAFDSPNRFDPRRTDVGRHMAFAMGPHMCIGFRLAKAEARAGLAALFAALPDFAIDLDASDAPSGYEFRQPARLIGRWSA